MIFPFINPEMESLENIHYFFFALMVFCLWPHSNTEHARGVVYNGETNISSINHKLLQLQYTEPQRQMVCDIWYFVVCTSTSSYGYSCLCAVYCHHYYCLQLYANKLTQKQCSYCIKWFKKDEDQGTLLGHVYVLVYSLIHIWRFIYMYKCVLIWIIYIHIYHRSSMFTMQKFLYLRLFTFCIYMSH